MYKSKLLRMLCALVVAYVLICLLVAIFQRRLIYIPFRQSEAVILARAGQLRCVPWRDSAGEIIGWKSARADGTAANRLVVFHGNAGFALHRTYFFEGFEPLDDGRTWEVYLFEYPGYGARAGSPCEKSFIEAGERALETLRRTDSRPVYLLGESLGSGLACALGERQPQNVAGVFLLAPFARLGDLAESHFRFLPVRLLLRERWDNIAALRTYPGLLAMFIAERDEVVGAAQGRLLFDEFRGRKRLWLDAHAQHNTIDFRPDAPWWREVSDFLLSDAPARLSPP